VAKSRLAATSITPSFSHNGSSSSLSRTRAEKRASNARSGSTSSSEVKRNPYSSASQRSTSASVLGAAPSNRSRASASASMAESCWRSTMDARRSWRESLVEVAGASVTSGLLEEAGGDERCFLPDGQHFAQIFARCGEFCGGLFALSANRIELGLQLVSGAAFVFQRFPQGVTLCGAWPRGLFAAAVAAIAAGAAASAKAAETAAHGFPLFGLDFFDERLDGGPFFIGDFERAFQALVHALAELLGVSAAAAIAAIATAFGPGGVLRGGEDG
jgi:hypothetical protein